MKHEILLKILFELLAKRQVSASYLAAKHKVAVRTIYRYIETLDYAGVPIYTKRGKNGGFCLIEDYKLPNNFFTKEELDLIFSTLKTINEEAKNTLIDGIINKLLSAKPTISKDIKQGKLIIDTSSWINNANHSTIFDRIQMAVNDDMVLKIVYQNKRGERLNRVIEPHAVLLKQGLWYILAFCRTRNDFRIFKIARIESVEATTEKFIPHYEEKEPPFKKWFDSPDMVKVKLKIEKFVLFDVQEWLGVDTIEKDNKNNYYATIELPFDIGLTEKLLSFGNGVKVLEPLQLQLQIKKMAQDILKNYE